MPVCQVKVPFGEEVVAILEVEYDIEGDGSVMTDTLEIKCEGFWAGILPRLYVPFNAKAGSEATLRDAFVEAALSVWTERIRDACQKHADDNKTVNAFGGKQ